MEHNCKSLSRASGCCLQTNSEVTPDRQACLVFACTEHRSADNCSSIPVAQQDCLLASCVNTTKMVLHQIKYYYSLLAPCGAGCCGWGAGHVYMFRMSFSDSFSEALKQKQNESSPSMSPSLLKCHTEGLRWERIRPHQTSDKKQ